MFIPFQNLWDDMVEKQSILYGAAGFIFMLLGSVVFVKILSPEKSVLNTLFDPVY